MKLMIAGCMALLLIGLAWWVSAHPVRVLNATLAGNHYQRISLAYGEHQRQRMDLYLPAEGVVPADKMVLFIQGGAWRYGDRGDYLFVAHALTELGYAVVIPDYRVYPEVHFPQMVEDVVRAMTVLVTDYADRLPANINGMVLMGHSAGAHLAALFMTEPRYLQTVYQHLPLRGLIGLSGPYDLPLDDPEVAPVFAGETAARVNPLHQLDTVTPPVLLLHGLADSRVRLHHTQRFAGRLREVGSRVELGLYERTGHRSVLASIAQPLHFLNPGYRDIKRFLMLL